MQQIQVLLFGTFFPLNIFLPWVVELMDTEGLTVCVAGFFPLLGLSVWNTAV